MNKIHPGDIVALKTRTVRHFVKNLGNFYMKPHTTEFVIGYASEMAMFLGAYLNKSNKAVGKVISYGARLDGTTDKFLMIKAKNKSGASDILALQESDVVLLKRKK